MANHNDRRETRSDEVLEQAWKMHNRGFAPREIADNLGIAIWEVQRIIDQGMTLEHQKSTKVRPETEEFAAHTQQLIRPTAKHNAKKAER